MRKSQISNHKSQIALLFLIAIMLIGCRPKGILHSWEMRDIIVDLHKTDALLYTKHVRNGDYEGRTIYYAQVMEKHGTTQAQFDSSLVWYTAHPNLFNKIYPKVLAELKEEEQAFLDLHPEFNANARLLKGDKKESVVEFTKWQFDSTLWVSQHGYPHSWNPLVRDFKDELFPQIGVTRGGVVDSLQTSVDLPDVAHD